MTTIAEAVARLEAAGVPSPRHDAAALARYLLGTDPLAEMNGQDLGADYDELVERRAAREPLQYIVGTAPFRHLEIAVGPGVFVPRPETELLAGWVIDQVRVGERPVVVDLCTGPGTIALAIAQEVPGATVYGVDIDVQALLWAQRNAAAHDLPVTFSAAPVAKALPDLDGTVDAVVTNPPYISFDHGDLVDPEAREHEPAYALFADDGGLAVIRDVIATGARLLRSGGVLAVEHGEDQGEVVPGLVVDSGSFGEVIDHKDLAGRPRFTTARRSDRA